MRISGTCVRKYSQSLMKVLIDGMPQHLAKPREPRVMRCGGCGCESEHQ